MPRYHIITLSILSLLFSLFIYNLQPLSGNKLSEVKEIYIDKGESFSSVSEKLLGEGLIRSARSFRWYGLFSGSAHAIKPGYYRVSPAESAVEITEKFVRGPEDLVTPIIEGLTVKDIDRKLSALGIIPPKGILNLTPKEFIADYPFLNKSLSFEGFLFPDTYRFAPHSDPKLVVRKMLDNFKIKAANQLSAKGKDFYKYLIIASLIEKEVPDVLNDRELVSGIIQKRLDIGMGLQIDVTVLYGKCGGALLTCESLKLSRDDFSIASPYNTYIHRGLPPTPISNPGAHAIYAALNPQKSRYLFYLSDPKTQKTIFSEDFDEHNDNRARYLGL